MELEYSIAHSENWPTQPELQTKEKKKEPDLISKGNSNVLAWGLIIWVLTVTHSCLAMCDHDWSLNEMCFHKINLTCACILPYGLLKPNSTIEIVVNLNDTNNVEHSTWDEPHHCPHVRNQSYFLHSCMNWLVASFLLYVGGLAGRAPLLLLDFLFSLLDLLSWWAIVIYSSYFISFVLGYGTEGVAMRLARALIIDMSVHLSQRNIMDLTNRRR